MINSITNNNGTPQILIKSVSITNYVNVTEKYPLPPELQNTVNENFYELMKTVFASALTEAFNKAIATFVDSAFGTGIYTLDASIINVTLNYQLSESPVFTNTYASFGIKGEISTKGSQCPYTSKLPTVNQTRDLQVYVSRTPIDCLLYAIKQLGVLDASYVLGKLNLSGFDSRTKVQVSLENVPQVSYIPAISNDIKTHDSMSAALSFFSSVDPKPFITLAVNASANVDISLNTETGDITVLIGGIVVTNINNQGTINPMIPDRYRLQLEKENWSDLVKKANVLFKGISSSQTVTLLEGYWGIVHNLFPQQELVTEVDYVMFRANLFA